MIYGPFVHRNTIHNSQDPETTKMSIDRQMNKDVGVCVCVCVYTHTMEYYSAMKKN